MARTCQESIADTDGKLQEQGKLIKQAKHVLSLPLQLKAVIPGPAQAGSSGAPSAEAASLPVFRAQSDLHSTPIEKNSIIPEAKKLTELATAKKAKKKKEKKERQKKLKEEKKKL